MRRLRGSGGVAEKQDRILRSLGLYRAGQISMGFANEPTFVGQLQKVPHHVEIIPLTAGAFVSVHKNKTIALATIDRGQVIPGRVMNRQDYRLPETNLRGEMVTLDDGEFIQCEQGEDCFSLLWSSATPIQTAYASASALISEHDKLQSGFVCFDDGNIVEGSSEDVTKALRGMSANVDLLRVDGNKFAFAWTARVGRLEGRQIYMNECSVVCREVDLDFLADFVRASSTISLGLQAMDLVKQFEPIMRSTQEGTVARN